MITVDTRTPIIANWESNNLGYSCDARLKKDEDGGYFVYVAQLPGVISQGDDVTSSLKNVMEALHGVIQEYKSSKKAIPWKQPDPKQDDEIQFRIAVNG